MPAHVRYKSLAFMGLPKYRIGDDGTLWSWRMARDGSHRWKRVYGTSCNGYPRAKLSGPGIRTIKLIHVLVLEAFVGPCPEGMEARHYPDPTRTNARLDNLSWADRITNQRDRLEHGTRCESENNYNCRHKADTVRQLREEYSKDHGMGQRAFARYWSGILSIPADTIRSYVSGRGRRYD